MKKRTEKPAPRMLTASELRLVGGGGDAPRLEIFKLTPEKVEAHSENIRR